MDSHATRTYTQNHTDTATAIQVQSVAAPAGRTATASRVLRNTYALLSMTLLFSAGIAAVSAAAQWPALLYLMPPQPKYLSLPAFGKRCARQSASPGSR